MGAQLSRGQTAAIEIPRKHNAFISAAPNLHPCKPAALFMTRRPASDITAMNSLKEGASEMNDEPRRPSVTHESCLLKRLSCNQAGPAGGSGSEGTEHQLDSSLFPDSPIFQLHSAIETYRPTRTQAGSGAQSTFTALYRLGSFGSDDSNLQTHCCLLVLVRVITAE